MRKKQVFEGSLGERKKPETTQIWVKRKLQQPVLSARSVNHTNFQLLRWQARIPTATTVTWPPLPSLCAKCWEEHSTFSQPPCFKQPPRPLHPVPSPVYFPMLCLRHKWDKSPQGWGLCGTPEKLLPLEQRPSGISNLLQNLLYHSFFKKMIFIFQEHRLEGN